MGFVDLALRLPSTSARWRSDGYRRELSAWVTAHLGPPHTLEPIRDVPWSTVWRVETDRGVHYAKENCPPQSFEAALVLALGEVAADHVVPVTAADAASGRLLTPDMGRTLREAGHDGIDSWCRVVAAGAALQREAAPYADRLADAGATTLAPADAVAYVEMRLEQFAALPAGDPRAMPAEARAAVGAHLPVVRRWVEQVAALGLPTTLVHNDLHDNNVFDVGGRLRFFDFGDALLMEPLAALLIPLNVLAHRLEAGPDDPRLREVAEAGLAVWSDRAPIRELRAALPAALQLARLGRVESWARCQASMNERELGEFGDSAAYWLGALLTDPPYGHLAA